MAEKRQLGSVSADLEGQTREGSEAVLIPSVKHDSSHRRQPYELDPSQRLRDEDRTATGNEHEILSEKRHLRYHQQPVESQRTTTHSHDGRIQRQSPARTRKGSRDSMHRTGSPEQTARTERTERTVRIERMELASPRSSPGPGLLISRLRLIVARISPFDKYLLVLAVVFYCFAVVEVWQLFTAYWFPYTFLDDADSMLIQRATDTERQFLPPVNQLIPVTALPASLRLRHHQRKGLEEREEEEDYESMSRLSRMSIQALELNSSGSITRDAAAMGEKQHFPPFTPIQLLPNRTLPKVAFLFLTRGPLPLQPLWEEFFQGNMDRASVYVHAGTEGWDVNAHVGQGSVFWGTQIPGIRIVRGMPSMIQATRRLLAAALEDSVNQRFILLSEACIPIRSFDFIYEYVFTADRSFLAVLPTLRWWRFPRFFWIFMPRQVLHPWQVKKGSQWFVLTRPHAALVVEDVRYYVTFGRGRAEYPDESYIQTVVWGYDRRGIEPHSVMHVEWPHYKSEHPTMYTGSSITKEVLERMQRRHFPVSESVGLLNVAFPGPCRVAGEGAPCFLFARKFSPSSLSTLMSIRDTLGF